MVYYYDSGTTGTTTSSGTYCTVTVATDATTSVTIDGIYYAAPSRPREIVVEHPADWTEDQHRAFIGLVNDEAKSCGWQITMLFLGGALALVDPNIEKRTMKDFVPLLKHRANSDDRQRIDEFFKANPA